jgi:alpha-L-fucosidase
MILTAKHHDGFCLWPSAHTEHSVKNSSWKGGSGDVVREFTDACREIGMKAGVYLSPWDRHESCYGDSPAYNRYFVAQLTELLSNYGDIAEVWFDGACGEGPNGKRQEYDWAAFYSTVRSLQPAALIAICGPDIRWVGNEDGFANETEWSVRPRDAAMHPQVDGDVWWPAECDVSIRPGWFWHPVEDAQVKSLADLVDIYYRSVGRNSVLLLNVPPNSDGLFAEPDVARLWELRDYLRNAFGTEVSDGASASGSNSLPSHVAENALDSTSDTWWEPVEADVPAILQIDLPHDATFNVVMIMEHVASGQYIDKYRAEFWDGAAWQLCSSGTTVGHKKLDRCSDVTTRRVRLVVESARGPIRIQRFELFRAPQIS